MIIINHKAMFTASDATQLNSTQLTSWVESSRIGRYKRGFAVTMCFVPRYSEDAKRKSGGAVVPLVAT